MNHTLLKTTCALSALIVMAGTLTQAADSYSPYAGQNYPSNVYFGDTHLHTSLSVDANIEGNEKLTPDLAYKFARGETVTVHNGMKARLNRPLDFLVIADHAEGMGNLPALKSGDAKFLQSAKGQELHRMFRNIPKERKPFYQFAQKMWSLKLERFSWSVWHSVTALADLHNDPGKFTTFIGYEWSPSATGNLHRVVLFKDGAERANQTLPFTATDSGDPEDLWHALEIHMQKTGGDAIAIPHNGNTSNGHMFSLVKLGPGEPFSYDKPGEGLLDAVYAKARSRWEPLYEVTQIKGDSEAHPLLSPDDEFADFGTWDSWKGKGPAQQGSVSDIERKKGEYARAALKQGLDLYQKLGVNPFKFGMIGSTDSHTSLTTADDNNFWGKLTPDEPNPTRMFDPMIAEVSPVLGWETLASGYAAVWATENTRESLFAAMKRKEVYATTGPRMTVRFFGGWDYDKADAVRPDLARIGYDGGVPMGGDLTHAPKGQAPKFLIRAVKDPDGANLDRVQVIKGWHDKAGELHEKIYNVALSDSRKDRGQKTRKVGSTVDVKDASYTNTIGDPELATVWTDPDFDKDELAFYYVRVLEIPTPRWTAYDAKFFNIKDIPEEIPMVTQERAYTSPIWYTP